MLPWTSNIILENLENTRKWKQEIPIHIWKEEMKHFNLDDNDCLYKKSKLIR